MPLPDDWDGTTGINDIFDLADDDPNVCPAKDPDGYRCNRPAGHDAEGYGHYDADTETIWWPDTITRERKP